jgi:hypothetical protein
MTQDNKTMTQEQAKIAADALRAEGHYDMADTLEEHVREGIYKNWWQNVYDNDQQDLY